MMAKSEKQIDKLVYNLYGLTQKEIGVVENSDKSSDTDNHD